ncbi:DJ-1/PfpI family protein [Deinococcus sonorensis]|uniref:DJ-1/PfpI family protein n=2 Tax=Deinococcus sonorensis TaxID=309891 RepID=A0AAU7UCA6_9DEIO
MSGPPDPDPQALPGPLVAVLMYPGVSELELGLMLGVLLLAGGEGAARTVARSRNSVVCAGGLVSTPQVMFAALPEVAGVLVPGGHGAQKAGRDPLLRDFLQAARGQGLPLGASGSGMLLAGEAGLLADRAVGVTPALADTVWGYLPGDVRPGEPVEDGPLLSAPGGLGAVQVTLGLSARLWGDEAARRAADSVGAAWTPST